MAEQLRTRIRELVQHGVYPRTARERALLEAGESENRKDASTMDVLRPTGQEIFDSLSKAEQDEMLGPAAAEKVRQGEATLSDFVEHDGGFIRQKPVEDL